MSETSPDDANAEVRLAHGNKKFGPEPDEELTVMPSVEEVEARTRQMYHALLSGDDPLFGKLKAWLFLLGESEWWGLYPEELRRKWDLIEDQWRIECRVEADEEMRADGYEYRYFLPW
jgi:hypothetical protein